MRDNKKIARNTLFLYIRMAAVLFISLYTTRLVLSTLGIVDYGIYNVVSGFVTLFSFLNATMSNSIQRFFNFEIGRNGESSIHKVYSTALMIQSIIAAIILILIETFGLWYVNNVMVVPAEKLFDANILFQLSTVSLVLTVIQVPFCAAIMAHERMDFYAIVSILDALIKLLAVLIISKFVNSYRLITYGVSIMGISLFNFLMYLIYCKRNFKNMKIRTAIDRPLFKSMLSFSGWRTMECFAYMLKGQGLNMLLNFYFGPIVNAANGIAVQVANAIEGFRINLFTAFNPQVVESYANGNHQRTKRLMYFMSKTAFILMLMISVPLVIELDYVLNIWLGEKNIPEMTSIFIVLFLANILITVFNVPLTTVVGATGKIKRYSITQTINVIAIIPLAILALNIIKMPQIVYYASLSVMLLNQVAVTFVAREEFPFPLKEYLKKVIMPCVATLLLSPILPIALHLVMPTSFVKLLIICIISVITVLSSAYLIALDNDEKAILKSFIHNKIPFLKH
ncbi:MAG: hypothetical protein ACI358_05485 [Candidatus Limimorpha sp.]